MIRLVLYEPDIPQNVGSILRLGACLGVPVDIVEPCGFVFDDRRLGRAGMDYARAAPPTRHPGWQTYRAGSHSGRLLLFTVHGGVRLDRFSFAEGDRLLFGRESAGVPDDIHEAADERVFIPMIAGFRSLNVAMCAAIATAEALRQIGAFPEGAEA